MVMSLFLLTSAGGSGLGVLVAPMAGREEWVGGMYAGLAVVVGGAGAGVWWVFGGDDYGGKDRGEGVEMEMEMESRGGRGRDV